MDSKIEQYKKCYFSNFFKTDKSYEFDAICNPKFTSADDVYMFVTRILKIKKIYFSENLNNFLANIYGNDLETNYYTNINIEIEKNIRLESYIVNKYSIDLECNLLYDILDLIDIFDKKKIKYFRLVCQNTLFNIKNSGSSTFLIHKNVNKVLKMCNTLYYMFYYYYHLINNYCRYKKGYYYSISKNKAVSLNEKNKNKIYKQYRKFICIKAEMDVYLSNFYNYWVDGILQLHRNNLRLHNFFSKIINYNCCFNILNFSRIDASEQKTSLIDLVNKEYIYINYHFNLKFIKSYYFNNENYFNYKENFGIDMDFEQCQLFSVYYHYMSKKFPDMTDESGIAYENYYVPIPILFS